MATARAFQLDLNQLAECLAAGISITIGPQTGKPSSDRRADLILRVAQHNRFRAVLDIPRPPHTRPEPTRV
jgi:hypothetical protein